MASRWSLPLVMALASGCAATGVAPGIIGAPSPQATVCPPAPAALNAHRAVAVAPTPGDAGTSGGEWVPYTYGYTVPSPWVAPSPLPLAGQNGAEFINENPMVVAIGETVTLKHYAYGTCLSPTWGVLETDRAQITPDGRLTAIAPGTLHVYFEANGRRRYMLMAVTPAKPEWLAIAPELPTHGGWGHGKPVYIQSADEWKTYWRTRQVPADIIPPAPPAIDFSRQTILTVPVSYNSGEEPAVLTEIVEGQTTRYRMTTPNHGHLIISTAVSSRLLFYVVNKRLGPAQVETEALYGDMLVETVAPASGPTPTPSTTPTPTPSLPPLPPPGPDAAACDPQTPWQAGQRDLELRWETPAPGYRPWAPVLRAGDSLRILATSRVGPVVWRVADPAVGTVDGNGLVTALGEGTLEVIAQAGTSQARAVIPVVSHLVPNQMYKFHDGGEPAPGVLRGTWQIGSQSAWDSFWTQTIHNAPPRALRPTPDFARYSYVALVEDRMSRGESDPVLAWVSDRHTVAHVVYPGIDGPAEVVKRRKVHLFAVRQRQTKLRFKTYSLCAPQPN